MPTRIYAPNKNNPSTSNWQTPSSISIYNDGWKTVKVAYNYDMGIWRVVYPDPIIPSYTNLTYDWTRDSGQPAEISIRFHTTTVEKAVVYLYNSSTPSGTPIQTAVLTPFSVVGNTTIWDHTFYASTQGNYSTKVVLTSITENTLTFYPGSLEIFYPTVSVLTAGTTNNTDFFVTWAATNQGQARISIYKTSDQSFIQDFLIVGANHRSFSTNTSQFLNNPFLANTQYTVYVEITDPQYRGNEIASKNFTSVDNQPAVVDITSTSSTCDSITVNWTNSYVSSGTITIYKVIGIEQGMFIYGSPVNYNFTPPTSSYTFTGLLPRLSSSATQGYYRIESVGLNIAGQQGISDFVDTQTTEARADPPSNFTATSSEYGSRIDLSWTAPPTGPCFTDNQGYAIQYKLSSSSQWTTLSNSIANTSTTYSTAAAGVTTTANTAYDFRIWTRSSPINSTYAYASVTTSNKPFSIYLSTFPSSTTTFNTVGIYAQLKNISGADAGGSGITVTFSATSGRGTFTTTTATTSGIGLASVTYTTNQTTGNIDFFGQAAGVPETGVASLPVSLSSGLTPTLSVARTNFGYDITHSNYNSSYSYSGSVGGGGFLSGGNWNTNFYTIIIPPIISIFFYPVASKTSTQVTCTSGAWISQPSATTTVTSSRTGYTDASSSVTSSPTGDIVSYDYLWYFDNGTVWGPGQTRNIGSLVKGKTIRCLVTATRTGGNQGVAWSNFITIPA